MDITLLQKTSSNPNKFKLVKVIKENTPNDGMEEWVPAADEAGDNLVLQVGCAKNYIFPEGCSSLESASQISSSVPQERASYLAGSLSAIKDILGRLSSFLKSFLLRN